MPVCPCVCSKLNSFDLRALLGVDKVRTYFVLFFFNLNTLIILVKKNCNFGTYKKKIQLVKKIEFIPHAPLQTHHHHHLQNRQLRRPLHRHLSEH